MKAWKWLISASLVLSLGMAPALPAWASPAQGEVPSGTKNTPAPVAEPAPAEEPTEKAAEEPVAEPAPLKVYVLAGGDNAAGYASLSDLHAVVSPKEYRDYLLGNGLEDIRVSYSVNAGTSSANVSQGFTPARAGMGVSRTRFGPELSLAKYLAEGEEGAYIIKYAVSDTALYRDWKYFTGTTFLTYVEAALKELTSDETSVELAGFVWFGGEHESEPGRYRKEIATLVSDFRTAFSEYGENIPFFNVGMTDAADYGDPIRTYQKLADYGENCYYVDTADLTSVEYNFNDTVCHALDAQSLLTLGERIGGAEKATAAAQWHEIGVGGKNKSIRIEGKRDESGVTFRFTQDAAGRAVTKAATATNVCACDFFMFWGDRSAISQKAGRPTPAEGLVRIYWKLNNAGESVQITASPSSGVVNVPEEGDITQDANFTVARVADVENDRYGVDVTLTYEQFKHFGNNKAFSATEPLYLAGLCSEDGKTTSPFLNSQAFYGDSGGTEVDRARIYDYYGMLPSGELYDPLDGVDFAVLDELAKTYFAGKGSVSDNVAKVTSKVTWTPSNAAEKTTLNSLQDVKVGASLYSDVSSFCFEAGAPLAFFGLKYVQSRRQATATVTAVESGYVFFWSYRDLTVSGMTKVIKNGAGETFSVDGTPRKGNYLQMAWLEKGQSLTFTNTSTSGNDNGVFIAEGADNSAPIYEQATLAGNVGSVSANIRVGKAKEAGIVFGADEASDTYYRFGLTETNNIRLSKTEMGRQTVLEQGWVGGTTDKNEFVTFTVSLEEGAARCFIKRTTNDVTMCYAAASISPAGELVGVYAEGETPECETLTVEKEVQAPHYDTVFIGHSYFEHWNYIEGGWLSDFPSLSAENAVNLGIGGSVASQWTEYIPEVASYAPKQVVYMIGINDLTGKVTPSTTASNVLTTLLGLKKALPEVKIVLVGVNYCSARDTLVNEIAEVNRLYRDIAEKYDWVKIAECEWLFNTDKEDPASTDATYFTADGLHLSASGYDLLAPVISSHLS